jgi:hypothetical protein
MKRILLAGLFALYGAAAFAQGEPARFSASYAVIAKGVTAGEFTFNASFDGGAYRANAERRLTGLARALAGSAQDYSYSAQGALRAGAARPASYSHKGGKRGRVVNVAFNADDVVTTATPAMGMGNPPATREQRIGTLDQVSMLVDMVALPAGADPCKRTMKIYMDGRARFDLVFRPNGRTNVSTKGFRGEAVRCAVAYRPIAGFSDPQDVTGDLSFVFGRLPNGMLAPLRIELPSDDAGIVVMEARAISATGSL